MNLKVINSNSKGNCYILETQTQSLILDCGVSLKEIQKALNFDLSKVCGCLVTHEHLDHAKSVQALMMIGVHVYSSKGTFEKLGMLDLNPRILKHTITRKIGDFFIRPFSVEHDAVEPLGFLIQHIPTGEKLLFATDTFYIRYKFQKLDYVILECNYIKDILDKNVSLGYIPEAFKKRLLTSHFSLDNVKKFLSANDISSVKKIVLIHLSDGNSDAKRMKDEIEELAQIETVIADKNMDIELSYPF